MSYKVAINQCYGGFTLTKEAEKYYEKLAGKEFSYAIERHDEFLLQVIEEMGADASGEYGEVIIEEIGVPFYIINDYDGWERIITPDNQNWIFIQNEQSMEDYPEHCL